MCVYAVCCALLCRLYIAVRRSSRSATQTEVVIKVAIVIDVRSTRTRLYSAVQYSTVQYSAINEDRM